MSSRPTPPMTEGKRGRFEIRLVVIAAVLFMILGGAWVFFKGSPTSHRVTIDSSEDTHSTVAPKQP
ncbi:hypothetical protein BH10PSE4_BH10PSE4_08770 [soil metagenome]